jgi:hypothetical protein
MVTLNRDNSSGWSIRLAACVSVFFCIMLAHAPIALAQLVLFDFDGAPLHSPLPLDLTAGGITARFAATGQGYSIQEANVLGFTPQGFSGYILYPNSIYLSDLLIRFNQTITDFSIMYSVHELACDTSATMRVSAFMSGTFVGTNTMIARLPGTWPVDTLSFSYPQGFDSVVVHYDSPPPSGFCQDYGVIYMADNMRVTALAAGVSDPRIYAEGLIMPNPLVRSATISLSLRGPETIDLSMYDIMGRLTRTLFHGHLNAGRHQLSWNVNDTAIKSGVYFVHLAGQSFSRVFRILVVK